MAHRDNNMNDSKPDKTWWQAHFDESDWHVKWGFDSGDCFTVFPLLPQLPEESNEERWHRSFVTLRDTGNMLCIASDVIEALLCEVLVARFDTALATNTTMPDSCRLSGFDWYFDNVYSIAACKDMCSLMQKAARDLVSLPDAKSVRITSTGEIVCQPPPDGELSCRPLSASEARRDCLLIAEYLERVTTSAEKQGALVVFSGP